MKEQKYCSGIMSESFWFIEFKRIVDYVKEGYSDDEIRQKTHNENLFGAVNARREEGIYGYVMMRIHQMDPDLIDIFLDSDIETQKLIDLICVLRKDRLFREFVYEVYRTKIILGENEITKTDISAYMREKEAQAPIIGTWKDTTVTKAGRTMITFLLEAGLLRQVDDKRIINEIMLDPALENYLINHEETGILKAITGAR